MIETLWIIFNICIDMVDGYFITLIPGKKLKPIRVGTKIIEYTKPVFVGLMLFASDNVIGGLQGTGVFMLFVVALEMLTYEGHVSKKLFWIFSPMLVMTCVDILYASIQALIFPDISLTQTVYGEANAIYAASAITSRLILLVIMMWIVRDEIMPHITSSDWLCCSLIALVAVISSLAIQYYLWSDSSNPAVLVLVVSVILQTIVSYWVIHLISNHIYVSSRNEAEVKVNTMREEHYHLMERKNAELRGLNHDIKNHMKTLQALISQGHYNEATMYLEKVTDAVKNVGNMVHSGNSIYDAVVGEKIEEAKNNNIVTEYDVCCHTLNMDDMDTCILFGNLFDNAIKANQDIPEDKRVIKFMVRERRIHQFIEVWNPVNDHDQEKLRKRLVDGDIAGTGLNQIQRVAMKYGGWASWELKNNGWLITVRIPCVQSADSFYIQKFDTAENGG